MSKLHFFKPSFILAFCMGNALLMTHYGSASQEETPENENIEVIEVNARPLDAAMRAFKAGDFQLAAIEFQKNAICARRQERALDALVTGLQNQSIDQNLQAAGGGNTSSSPSQVGPASTSGNAATTGGGNASNTQKPNATKSRTCSDRDFQLYMTGLSQLQLGQIEDAEKSFRKASVENNRLYDAHYRLGLIFLLNEDNKDAQKRVDTLKDLQALCKDCDAKVEIQARIQHLENALSGKVRLK